MTHLSREFFLRKQETLSYHRKNIGFEPKRHQVKPICNTLTSCDFFVLFSRWALPCLDVEGLNLLSGAPLPSGWTFPPRRPTSCSSLRVETCLSPMRIPANQVEAQPGARARARKSSLAQPLHTIPTESIFLTHPQTLTGEERCNSR